MKGAVGSAIGIQPLGGVGGMLTRVPAAGGDVDAAAERHLVIDDDYLLVMRTGGRVVGIKNQAQSAMRSPRQAVQRQDFPIKRKYHREIPAQDADTQAPFAPDCFQQKIAQSDGPTVGGG